VHGSAQHAARLEKLPALAARAARRPATPCATQPHTVYRAAKTPLSERAWVLCENAPKRGRQTTRDGSRDDIPAARLLRHTTCPLTRRSGRGRRINGRVPRPSILVATFCLGRTTTPASIPSSVSVAGRFVGRYVRHERFRRAPVTQRGTSRGQIREQSDFIALTFTIATFAVLAASRAQGTFSRANRLRRKLGKSASKLASTIVRETTRCAISPAFFTRAPSSVRKAVASARQGAAADTSVKRARTARTGRRGRSTRADVI